MAAPDAGAGGSKRGSAYPSKVQEEAQSSRSVDVVTPLTAKDTIWRRRRGNLSSEVLCQ